ncbi:Uma2 family endonuclease [Synechococcales cyanobacterium C]|uniref:Uma2 family endonuclease n=1 Tax=Petrachloros mirabilis ULC683 TaxID=2781853 RepID=A0A8K2A618_9CYAN|nr:Uma2 family endonuclease [Petrachloros mirabilis]NCJ05019.1 Uma2 family endonuclease [Petrachloros mirabilis ULC683]
MTQAAERTYTAEEYLELEINSATRHEFGDGDIRPMTGGTPDHNDIAGNLLVLLKSALRGKPYRTFVADQRLWIPTRNIYTYPDVMVVPKPIQLQAGRKDTVTNPCFIAEVLSTSTKDYDRGDKFLAYRTMPTFQEYLLIDQYTIHIEHHVKTSPHQWLLSEYHAQDATLSCKSFDCQIKLSDLYEEIDLANIEW